MSVAFDTLKFVERLEAGGFSPTQARAAAEAFADATGEQLATKADLREGLAALDARFARIDGELMLLKWMVGFVLAMVAAILFLLLRH